MMKSDDFLLQLLWIRDYSSGLDLPFWPFTFLSHGVLKFLPLNQMLVGLVFYLVPVIILYNLISAFDGKKVLRRFVKLGISGALFLTLTSSQFKYYTYPTYQFWSIFISLSSCLLFVRSRERLTYFKTVGFALLTLCALFARFPQSLFVVSAFIAALTNSKKDKIRAKTSISTYILVVLSFLGLITLVNKIQIQNLYNFVNDSLALSTMPIERPITNVLYTSLITVVPLSVKLLRVRQGIAVLAIVLLIVAYNLFYFNLNREFFENVAIALFFVLLAIKINTPPQLLKSALLINVFVSSFLFGSYNAIRDFQGIQVALCCLTILYYYLSRQREILITSKPRKSILFMRQILAYTGILLLLVKLVYTHKEDVLVPLNSVTTGELKQSNLFIDLTGRQDAWLFARDNGWAVFPYVIPAYFPSRNKDDRRVLAMSNEILEKRVGGVLDILKRIHNVDKFIILVEWEHLNSNRDYEVSQYSSTLLKLLKLESKICETDEKFNQKNLPKRTLVIEACL